MKRKTLELMLSVTLAVTLSIGAPAAVFAAEADAQTEEAAEAEDATAADFQIGDLTVKNTTAVEVKSAELKESEQKEEASEKTDKDAASGKNLILTLEDGTEHIFANVDTADWKEPSLYNEYEVLYISFKDANSKEQEVAEEAEEKAVEGDVTVYTTTRVNVRETPSTDAKSLKVAVLGDEFKLEAAYPGWLKVKNDKGDVEGYISHKYVTADKEYVDKLLADKKAAEEAAAAAAQAAQEQAAASYDYEESYDDYSYSEPAESQPAAEPVTEVSREAYDDCDGSGHGYYEITYSDGSTATEEY